MSELCVTHGLQLQVLHSMGRSDEWAVRGHTVMSSSVVIVCTVPLSIDSSSSLPFKKQVLKFCKCVQCWT